MKSENTLTFRVNFLEKEYKEIDKKLEKIMTNHLPHLQESIARLETRIMTFTAINIATVIISILLREIL